LIAERDTAVDFLFVADTAFLRHRLFRFEDYNAAAISVLPVKLGMPSAKKHIVVFITVFMAATLLLTFCGYCGYGYLASALALGLS
jgi:protoheme IX farnesyltransferase